MTSENGKNLIVPSGIQSRRAVRLASLSISMICAFFILRFAYVHLNEFDWTLIRPRMLPLFLSFLSICISLGISSIAWKINIEGFGYALNMRQAYVTLQLPQLTAFFPSRIFPLASRIMMIKAHGIPYGHGGGAVAIHELSLAAGSFALALAGLVAWNRSSWTLSIAVAGSLFFFLLFMHPGVIKSVLYWMARGTGRKTFQLPERLTLSRIGLLSFLQFTSCTFLALAFFQLAVGIGGLEMPWWMSGSYILAKVLGSLAFFTPNGLGIQEASLLYILRESLSPTMLLVLVAAARIWFSLVDLLGACLALALQVHHAKEAQKIW